MIPEFGYDEERNLIWVKLIGQVTVEEYQHFADFVNSLPRERKMRYLVDISRMDNSLFDRKTRNMVSESTERIPGSKIAMLGGSPITRMIAKTIVATMGKLHETGFFKTEEKAITWLDREVKS